MFCKGKQKIINPSVFDLQQQIEKRNSFITYINDDNMYEEEEEPIELVVEFAKATGLVNASPDAYYYAVAYIDPADTQVESTVSKGPVPRWMYATLNSLDVPEDAPSKDLYLHVEVIHEASPLMKFSKINNDPESSGGQKSVGRARITVSEKWWKQKHDLTVRLFQPPWFSNTECVGVLHMSVHLQPKRKYPTCYEGCKPYYY